MQEENKIKRINPIKIGSKILFKFTSVALLFTLAITLNSNFAEAKNTKAKQVQKKQQKIKPNKNITNKVVNTKNEQLKTNVKTNVKTIDDKLILSNKINHVKRYTGLIVMVNPEKPVHGKFSPKIISKGGLLIFGGNTTSKNTDTKFVVNNGITASTDTIVEFIKINNKEKPLIIHSTDTISLNGSEYLIISDADALKILLENQASSFIEGAKVSFLQDTKPVASESPYGNILTVEKVATNTVPNPEDPKIVKANIIINPEINITNVKPTNTTNITTEIKPIETSSINISPENNNTHSLNTIERIASVPDIRNINVVNPDKFTSLIIDCSGLGLVRGMSPVVLTATEFDFYPGIILDSISDPHKIADVMNSGLVTYANSMNDAKSHKLAGKNPMIIRAIEVQGILKSDPVIDIADAARLININGKSNILDDRKLILIY